MSLSLKEIETNYRKYTDSKIIQIAQNKVASLKPEVLNILNREIIERNLDKNLFEGIKVQVEPISQNEVIRLTELVTSLSCPVCSHSNESINAVLIKVLYGAFFESIKLERLFIACPSCIKKERAKARLKSFCLGWWSPLGIIHTPIHLIKTYTEEKKFDNDDITILYSYVLENLGEIKTIETNQEQMWHLIKRNNTKPL